MGTTKPRAGLYQFSLPTRLGKSTTLVITYSAYINTVEAEDNFQIAGSNPVGIACIDNLIKFIKLFLSGKEAGIIAIQSTHL